MNVFLKKILKIKGFQSILEKIKCSSHFKQEN
jgi:hypothetical protein